jgi:phage shock protein PspC (stress-responsive transcriptional regulator)
MADLPDRPDRPRLRRSRHERVLFGVCGGLAEYFGWDPTVVRVGLALVTLFPPTSLVGLLGYVVLGVLLPEEGSEHLPGRERVQRNLAGLREDVSGLTDTVRSGLRRGPRDLPAAPGRVEPPVADDEAIDRASGTARRY